MFIPICVITVLVTSLQIAGHPAVITKLLPGERLNIECELCRTVVGAAEELVIEGVPTDVIVDNLSEYCSDFGLFKLEVCRGAIEAYADIVIYILNNTQTTRSEICSLITGTCGNVTSDLHNWDIPLPDTVKPPVREPVVKPSKPTLKVLHISDTHYDPDYVVGSSAECGEPACCQGVELPNNDPRRAGKWGDYRSCDTPERTMDSMLQHIKNQHRDLDFVIWTGDLPNHHIWKQTKEGNLAIINTTIAKVFETFPNIPVYPAVGNHESEPVNSFSPPGVEEKWSMSWLYDQLDVLWSHWLPSDTSNTIKFGAYFSTIVRPGLKLISLNMNFCLDGNFWIVLNSTDMANELTWLVTELQTAEDKGEKVHIIGHVPPGGCIAKWSENYYKIINRYEDTVRGQFFGHTHKDAFSLMYDMETYKRPLSVVYIGPSLTPYSDLNPGYRIYYVDGDHNETTWTVTKHESWYMDLQKANEEDNPTWQMLYTTDEYNMETLLPRGWDDLFNRMRSNRTLFDLYTRYRQKNSPLWEPCDSEDCVSGLLCDIRSGRSHYSDILCNNLI